MFEWLIGATIRVSSNGVQAFRGLSVAAAAANTQLNSSLGLISKQDAAWARYEQRMQRINSRWSMLGVGVAAGIAGAGALAIEQGVAGAAKLEMAMTTVGVATGATAKQLASLRKMVLSVSGVTAQSSDTIAQEMATAARAGLSSYARLSQAFPAIAKFADVMYLSGKASGQEISPVEAVNVGTQFAHYFQAYKPSQLLGTQKNPGMLDWLTRLMMVQPESINRLLTQGKYFIPFGRALGMSTEQLMDLLGVMGQTGFLRGKGGTSIGNTLMGAINAAALTGFGAKKRKSALSELGILDASGHNTVIKQGKLDWDALLHRLATAADHLSSVDYARDLKNAFNSQSSYFLSVLNTPAVRAQTKFIDDAMKRMGTVESFFARFVNNLIPQVIRTGTNLANLLIDVFLPTLPFLTKEFKALADQLGRWGDWFAAHPKAAMGAAIAAFAAVAAGATFAAIQMWKLNAAIWNLGKSAEARSFIPGGGVGNVARASEGEGVSAVQAGATSGIGNVARAAEDTGAGVAVGAGIFARMGLALSQFWEPFAVFGRLLLQLGARFIPVAGWVLAAVAAIEAFSWTIQHLPNIVATIVKWWREDRYKVAYEIGYVFGTIGRMIQEAIVGMLPAVGAALRTLASSFYLAFTPSGQHKLVNDMIWAAENASRKTKDNGGAVQGLLTGGWAGANGQPNAYVNGGGARSGLTINGGVHITLPRGSTKDHADAIMQELARRMRISPQHDIRTQPGGFLTHPGLPPALHPAYGTGGAH